MEINIPKIVDEADYENVMHSTVEPLLATIGTDGYFEGIDGENLHYVFYPAENAIGSVVVLHGFTECAEKFREMFYYFHEMGLNVFSYDHRGHGYSYRVINDPETIHINRFSVYVSDAYCFLNKKVKPLSKNLPLYVYSHSMGGAITVQFLQEYPGIFKKAVLSSPMIAPITMGMPQTFVRVAMGVLIGAGQAKKRVPGASGFNADRKWENSNDTSEVRFRYYHAKRVADRHYQTSSPSCRWASESVKVIKKNLDPKRNETVNIPVLLFQSEKDGSVENDKQEIFISLLKNGRLIKTTGTKHEIYMSPDKEMEAYLGEIARFLSD